MLAIDCGGSQTRAGFYDASGTLVSETVGGPANPVADGIGAVVTQITQLADHLKVSVGVDIAVGVAGARDAQNRFAVWSALANTFRETRIVVCDDQIPVLLANCGKEGGILITAGTGSCVVAADASGAIVRKGGRGPLLGDDGSAYAIAADALKRAARAADGAAPPTLLVEGLPASAGVATFDDLIGWQRTASKSEVAALARTVCTAADDGDAIARTCLQEQAALLAATVQAARSATTLDANATMFLNGGMLEQSALYVERLTQALHAAGFESTPILAPLRGHAAVHALAKGQFDSDLIIDRVSDAADAAESLPPTERKSEGPALDSLDARGIVRRMLQTNFDVDAAMMGAAESLASAVDYAASAITEGGRIIYAGAGTSGRLAVLDAAECRPTFGVESGTVIALIAGGDRALVESVEEAEDSRDAGRIDLIALEPPANAHDFVIGITASGSTPYACAVVEQAAKQGARTAMLTCNADSPDVAPLMIRLSTGAEVLPGSTRLKAGTATKLALNIISTGAFARAGHIYDGWMVGVRPINTKLRARATRIISVLTALDEPSSRKLLEDAGNRIPVAMIMHHFQVNRTDAEARLENAGGNLRAAMDT